MINYCSYLLKSFALCEINRFSWKQNRVFADTRKYYSVDPGLVSLYSSMAESHSTRLENVVFLELKRRGKKIFFGTNDTGRELDFLASNGDRHFDRYQVAVTLNADDERRELGAFFLADPYLKTGDNIFLSLDEGVGERQWQGVKIFCNNLITWLLF